MRVIETQRDQNGVYQPKRIIERNVEQAARKKARAPQGRMGENKTPVNPLSDVVGILQGLANAANAISRLMRK